MITNEYKAQFGGYFIFVYKDGVQKKRLLQVDIDDSLRLRRHTWTVTSRGYGQCTKCGVLLHRFVTGAPPDLQVDHINRSPSCNIKRNLRLVTHQQNMWNKRIQRDRSSISMPVAGVYQRPSGRWQATIDRFGHAVNLGLYEHLYDACLARARYEYDHFKEFTPIHRRWMQRVPFEFRLSWFPEIYGLDNDKFKGSGLHRSFFADKTAIKASNKLRAYRKEHLRWKAAINV